ncbi:MAG: hypothetical protein IJW18_00170 [Lachnospiraceae bacterium]|nr:hypothetical protein [Lachnospiraceae bacterium]
MSGNFCLKKYSSDKEYAKLMKKRAAISLLLVVFGIVTLAISLYCRHKGLLSISDFRQGVFAGIGTGLALFGLILFFICISIIKNESKLKAARIYESDERNIAITTESISIATVVLLISMYVVFVLSIFMEIDIIIAIAIFVLLFVLTTIISAKINSHRM